MAVFCWKETAIQSKTLGGRVGLTFPFGSLSAGKTGKVISRWRRMMNYHLFIIIVTWPQGVQITMPYVSP